MNNLEEIFFTLMRAAIWDTTPVLPRAVGAEEWNSIYAISKEQTVSGIMLDAIAKLPDEQKPDIKLRMQWIMMQKFIESQNRKMNSTLTTLVSEMKEQALEPYLLKGQGVALNYPLPEHRICGDIDIYFNTQQFEKAAGYFTSKGYELEGDPDDAHCETEYKGFKVEIHKKSATFYTKKLQKRYNEIIDTILETEKAYIEIEGCRIAVLPPLANALQMLSHMLRHIIFSGLGLRQICDWVLFVHSNQANIDKELFIKYARELQLWGTYKIVTAIATDYLGLSMEYALCDISKSDKRMAKKAFCLIMTYGNFGQYGEHAIASTKKEYLQSYIWKVKNCIRFHKVARLETWNYPIWQLHSIIKILKEK